MEEIIIVILIVLILYMSYKIYLMKYYPPYKTVCENFTLYATPDHRTVSSN